MFLISSLSNRNAAKQSYFFRGLNCYDRMQYIQHCFNFSQEGQSRRSLSEAACFLSVLPFPMEEGSKKDQTNFR